MMLPVVRLPAPDTSAAGPGSKQKRLTVNQRSPNQRRSEPPAKPVYLPVCIRGSTVLWTFGSVMGEGGPPSRRAPPRAVTLAGIPQSPLLMRAGFQNAACARQFRSDTFKPVNIGQNFVEGKYFIAYNAGMIHPDHAFVAGDGCAAERERYGHEAPATSLASSLPRTSGGRSARIARCCGHRH